MVATWPRARFAGRVATTDPLIERGESLVVGGKLIGRYHHYAGERPSAELFEKVVNSSEAARVIVEQLRGWNLTTTDEELSQELIRQAAQSVRQFSLMSIDLNTWLRTQDRESAATTL